MSISFSFKLVGDGWAECALRIDEEEIITRASSISNAAEDFISAVAAALRGHPCAVTSFAQEPGESRWFLESRPNGKVRVRVLQFAETSLRPDTGTEGGYVRFAAECRLRTFAGRVLSEFQRLKAECGLAGYRNDWRHEFPLVKVEEIQALLKTRAMSKGGG